jgi:hypothetical protein
MDTVLGASETTATSIVINIKSTSTSRQTSTSRPAGIFVYFREQ